MPFPEPLVDSLQFGRNLQYVWEISSGTGPRQVVEETVETRHTNIWLIPFFTLAFLDLPSFEDDPINKVQGQEQVNFEHIISRDRRTAYSCVLGPMYNVLAACTATVPASTYACATLAIDASNVCERTSGWKTVQMARHVLDKTSDILKYAGSLQTGH